MFLWGLIKWFKVKGYLFKKYLSVLGMGCGVIIKEL